MFIHKYLLCEDMLTRNAKNLRKNIFQINLDGVYEANTLCLFDIIWIRTILISQITLLPTAR